MEFPLVISKYGQAKQNLMITRHMVAERDEEDDIRTPHYEPYWTDNQGNHAWEQSFHLSTDYQHLVFSHLKRLSIF